MEQKKKYFIYLDILRLISCIAVFLYHLNVLKGGYLAVCSFFVISSFLSCISESKRENFSLKKYYISKLVKLYVPLVAVVFVTISFLSLSPDILIPSLKPEVKSILLGYNNFWQLSANMDYFAQHIDSPFMHLWYVSILLQFDLVFPLIYIPLRKLGDKCHKTIPCALTIVCSIAGCIYFYIASLNQNIMASYYNTFSRMFSLLFGLSLGFIHHYYAPLIPKILKNKKTSVFIFFTYILILISLFYTIDASSKFFQISMIVASLITCRIIDYSIVLSKESGSLPNKIIKYFSSISYEFYLLQYPLIFYLQCTNISENLKLTIILPLLLILSCIFHYILSKNKEKYLLHYIFEFLLLVVTVFGIYKFCTTKDNTQEMNELRAELAQNEAILAAKQDEYNKKFQEKQQEFEKAMKEIDVDEGKLAEMVTNVPIVAMGDSVMENNAKLLYQKFPNMYIDAKYLRVASYAVDALQNLKDQGKLADIIILEFGANGDCTEAEKNKIMEICEGKQVFWLTVPNDRIVKVNDKLFKLAEKYDNLHIIDWYTITRPHPEYFISDKVHLNSKGKEAFTQVLYDALYDYYSNEISAKKEALEKEYDEILNNLGDFGDISQNHLKCY
ncbi:MAG: acyltransferase [Clostridia bacterium]|nr:acyltransferase [Clostridia bacterium]